MERFANGAEMTDRQARGTAVGRKAAHLAIRGYQLTLSGFIGRGCRYLPTCSDYTDEAIQMHGLWAGGWMGLARICRCHPWGNSGFDPVPPMPERYRPYRPWTAGDWRGPQRTPTCD